MGLYYPKTVNLFSNDPDNEITWKATPISEPDFLLGSRWSTVKSLLHRSNPATGDLCDRTWEVHCTNFDIVDAPDVISGIQLEISGQRNGRICDEIIQLCYQGSPIGTNNFHYELDSEGHFYINNQMTYGGPTDLWGAELTPEIIQDPSFGVILKFQSHPYYPHNCGMFLDKVTVSVF